MLSVESLQDAVTDLFRGGVDDDGYDEDEVEEMLAGIDFHALCQTIRHEMGKVYSFATQGKHPMSFNYRGPVLFEQDAVCLCEERERFCGEGNTTISRCYELWLLEDMTFVPVVCVAVSSDKDEYSCEYRCAKDRDPWDSGMPMDLDELSAKLRCMCESVYEDKIPVYEL